MDYKRQKVELPAWRIDHGDGAAISQNLEYFLVSLQFHGFYVVDLHVHWALVTMSYRFARRIDDLSFFSIIPKIVYDSLMAYVALRRKQNVDWSCTDLLGPVFISLVYNGLDQFCDNCVHQG